MTSHRHRSFSLIAIATAIALALVAAFAARPAEAATGTWSFSYTGAPQTFTVPPEVHKLSMVVVGGAGTTSGSNLGGAAGGVSGLAYGTFDVTPGEVLQIWVGAGGRTQMGPAGVAWGFGCGAPGGEGEAVSDENGGGGGASSAVTKGEFADLPGDCLIRPAASSVLVVGGGGGGGGANDLRPPQEEPLSFGGAGGDGGVPAGSGRKGGGFAPGGCGGCESLYHGATGAPGAGNAGGAGGGGGGYKGGQGGGVAIEEGGGGGGGGSSFVASGAEDAGYLGGYGSGPGSVLLSALGTELFPCTGGGPQTVQVPEGAGLLKAEATGGAGGTPGPGLGGAVGTPGTAMSEVRVSPGERVEVFAGCAGSSSREPGWGYGSGGSGGHAPADHALNGGGGGGSSGVVVGGKTILIAGGGGGGGGSGAVFGNNNNGAGGSGGAGGNGGFPATDGTRGQPEDYSGGHGGKGGILEGLDGGAGGTAGHGSLGGGGGGGGAGWYDGAGGYEGRLGWNLVGGGAGGGGGGLSGVTVGALDFSYGTSTLTGNGFVELTYMPPQPAAISAYGGSKQRATIGAGFAQPLAALVTDAVNNPVPNASVVFTLPGGGASGSFGSGGTTQTVSTGPKGIAISSPVTANRSAGAWQASASVGGVSTPAGFALVNAPSPTATALTASQEPATPTEPVTFTAKVAAASPSAGTPAGSVQFRVDGADLGAPVALDGSGSATSTPATGLSPGSHEVEARYEGSADYLPSKRTLQLPVEKTTTATHVTSSLNPALPTEAVTFTAAIAVPAGNAPYSGSVQFSVDGTPLGAPQAASNGTATSPPYETTVVGPHAVTAVTAETADYEGSEGSMVEVVDPDGSAVHVTSSANPAEYGSALQLEAEVLPRPPVTLTPTGAVTFAVGGEECSGILAAGRTSCSPAGLLAPGPHEVAAAYGGDADFEPGAGSMVQQITKARTALEIDASPEGEAVYGEEVTFSAEVDRLTPGGGAPSGTVQFALDGEPIGAPAPLGPEGATSPAVEPAGGAHVVTAAYSGDADFYAAGGSASYQVLPAPTTVALSSAPEPSQPGQAVAFTAAVEAAAPADGGPAPVPTGRVQFRVDGADFGLPVELEAGRAVSPGYEGLEPGRHDVTATYEPVDDDFEPSHASAEHDVDQPTVTVMASAANPSPEGEPVTVAAHVGPLAPAGTISFQVDGRPALGCQAVPVRESDATCTLTGLAAGAHDVRAAYSGAPLFDPSQGALVQEVLANPATQPAARCQLREVRGRMLVHRHRNAIRLVARYRAKAKGEVAIRFFARRGEDRKGRRLGALRRTFHKRGLARLQKRLPARWMKRLRASGRGFIAEFRLGEDPGYCAEAFSKELDVRREVSGQQVWFQSDSSRAELPKNSR